MRKNILIAAVLCILAVNLQANDDCLYLYKAHVTDVYDGDTITIDLGFNTWIKDERIRLARINTPEVRGKEKVEGKLARDWLREKILNQDILLRTIKSKKGADSKGKYGRYLGEIMLDGMNLVDAGLLIIWNTEWKTSKI